MTRLFLRGYFKIILTIGILVLGLLHLPTMDLKSLEGIFSSLWFIVGGLIVAANFVYITRMEKVHKRIKKTRARAIHRARNVRY